MEINYFYLIWFILYLAIVLGIGLWGWQQVSNQRDFAIGSQRLSLLLTSGSMYATFISAVSVIGGVGYASQHGFALLTLFTTGSVAGCAFLAVSARRWHAAGVSSVSEFMAVRYDSQFLRTLLAVIIVFTYAIILVAQLLGVGYIVEGVIGIPIPIAVLCVGLFFVAYTILGGMVSVARTDVFQALVMTLGVLLTALVLVSRLAFDPAHSLTQRGELFTLFAGQTPDLLSVTSYVFVFGLGVAIHPYYVQRLLAAREVGIARFAAVTSGVGVFVMQVLLVIIGIVGSIYLPGETGDPMLPLIIKELMGGVLGAVAMMAILAGVQSTTDSLLHIVGTYMSQDIFCPFFLKNPSPQQQLFWSRVFTALFGVTIVVFTCRQALHGELELIAVIAAYAWGVLGGSLFVPVAAGLFWKKATRQGAIAAVLTGFFSSVAGHILVAHGFLGIHEVLPATFLALVAMVAVSLYSGKQELN